MNDLHVTIGHNVRGVPTHNTVTVCATAARILGIEGMTAYQCVGYWHGEHEASTRIEVCSLNDDEAAGELRFWRVSFETGYYCGAQIRVRLPEDPRELESAECRELWDLCRSRAVSALEAETRRLKRALDAFAEEKGLFALRVSGRFSSGEAVYEKVA